MAETEAQCLSWTPRSLARRQWSRTSWSYVASDQALGLYVPKKCPPEEAVARQGFCIRVWSSANGTIHDLRHRFAREWVAGNIAIWKRSYTKPRWAICHPERILTVDVLVPAIEIIAVNNAIAEFVGVISCLNSTFGQHWWVSKNLATAAEKLLSTTVVFASSHTRA